MQKFPNYCQKGSSGPAIDKLGEFLEQVVGVVDGQKFVQDGQYGEVLSGLVRAYQDTRGLKVDGHCGPQTQTSLRENGFDLQMAAETSGGGSSIFAQPNGDRIPWPPMTGK